MRDLAGSKPAERVGSFGSRGVDRYPEIGKRGKHPCEIGGKVKRRVGSYGFYAEFPDFIDGKAAVIPAVKQKVYPVLYVS